jgi:chemotaxis family two-component system sensor kinase Cph1
LASDLRPTALDDLGMTAALSNHVDEWSQQTGIAADFCSRHCEERLSTHIETTLYRVVQEALTNVARHAEARHASIVLERRPDCVVVIVEDDGIGFDVRTDADDDGRRHFGLVGIRERAALLGGTATIESSATMGTSVFVQLPLRRQSRADG